jgi:hypothetical protein
MATIIKDSDMSKEYKISDNSSLYSKNDYNELTLTQSHSLYQGNKFKKKQKKNTNINNMITNNMKEGFSLQNGPESNTSQQSKDVLLQAQLSPAQEKNIRTLKNNFNQALEEYQQLYSEITGSVNTYISRTGTNNPYISKNIKFTDGTICYVTNKGVAKPYTNFKIYKATAGVNGCPSEQEIVDVNMPFSSTYTEGTQIPTTPPLIVGTSMTQGQSCGNEGENVFVNSIISNPTTKYLGCYADNSSGKPTMSFIGGAPSPPTNTTIVNGNFSQPPLSNNNYGGYFGTNTAVPGWYFNAYILNNWSGLASYIPIPYPGGNQCTYIYSNQYIYQVLNLTAGTYSLSFSGSSFIGNPLTITVASTNSTPTQATQTFNANPPQGSWTSYTETFNITTSGPFQIAFTGKSGSQASALTNISISSTNNNNANGTYTYGTCEQAAIDGGYKYFALQNVNQTTSQGYCAVSNDKIIPTSNGIAYAVSGQTALWTSKTSGQSGNTCSFNNGSLIVNNSSGAAVFSTPNNSKQPSTYIGCYADKSTRAMTSTISSSGQVLSANSGPYSYGFGVQQCQQAAQKNNASYFGLQNSTIEGQAVCFISNDLTQTKQYGVANNCTQFPDGTWSGGGWSNSVYSTSTPTVNYFLILQDDGNMCIYLGGGPNDNQGLIWQTRTTGKQQKGNPLMVASKNQFKQNWMPSGSVLSPGQFLSSTQGDLVLIMQSDGNLVLYTYQTAINCQKMADGNTGGGLNANSLYELSSVGIPGNMEKLSYIDQDSKLYTYPDSNIQLGTTYTKISGYGTSSGNNIYGASFGNATPDTCQTACNNNQSCGGFTFDNTNSICYPKTTGMYPNSARQPSSGTDIYIRNKIVQPLPPGVSSLTQNIDTVQYQNYVSSGKQVGGNMNNLKIDSVQKAKLEQMQTKLQLLANKIVNLNGKLNLTDIKVTSQSAIDSLELGKYLVQYKITDAKLDSYNSDVNTNVQNILNDSDIIVLQQNYKYMFWTTLAVGTVLLSMNIV